MVITIKADIEKDSVLRYLGYTGSRKVPAAIHRKVDEVLGKIPDITGSVVYDEFTVTVDNEERRVYVDKLNYFSCDFVYDGLRHCANAIIAISTVDPIFHETYKQIASLGGVVYEMIIDAIGTAAINNVNYKFREKLLSEYAKKGLGLTKRFAPGDNEWKLMDQRTIFNVLNGDSIQVKLNDSYVMEPVKSLTMVYGIMHGPCYSQEKEHDCENCSNTRCGFRVENRKYRVKVTKSEEVKFINASHGENLFEALTANNIVVENSCGGAHTCGKCVVLLERPVWQHIGDEEKSLLNKVNAPENARLACFISINEDMHVKIPQSAAKVKIMVSGAQEDLMINPRITKTEAAIPEELDGRDDLSILAQLLHRDGLKIPAEILKRFINSDWSKKPSISCVLHGDEIIDICDDKDTGTYGIAVDIGTTTVAAYLMDLKTGAQIDVYSCLNPQKIYGADVISRISRTYEDEKALGNLHGLISNQINDIIDYFCKNNGIKARDIFETILVGNTTMLHMALEIPCKNIANFPFRPAFTQSMKFKSKDMGIKQNPESYVMTLPIVSGFVGADTMAAILASGMHEDSATCLLIDIGTNGEIALGNKNGIISCSTAAGPAFEGGKLTFGIGGIDGAIDHVNLEQAPIYTTIGNFPPVGICGSGITDAIAELLRYGIVDFTGKLLSIQELKDQLPISLLERMLKFNNLNSFMIDQKSGILITQADIREFQLAKAAIHAGVSLLMDRLKIGAEDISKVFLAGGFGNFMNLDSIFTIKLLPEQLKGKVKAIGNGAGTGAKMALLSDDAMYSIRNAAAKIQYIELSTSAEFQNKFIKAMRFR